MCTTDTLTLDSVISAADAPTVQPNFKPGGSSKRKVRRVRDKVAHSSHERQRVARLGALFQGLSEALGLNGECSTGGNSPHKVTKAEVLTEAIQKLKAIKTGNKQGRNIRRKTNHQSDTPNGRSNRMPLKRSQCQKQCALQAQNDPSEIEDTGAVNVPGNQLRGFCRGPLKLNRSASSESLATPEKTSPTDKNQGGDSDSDCLPFMTVSNRLWTPQDSATLARPLFTTDPVLLPNAVFQTNEDTQDSGDAANILTVARIETVSSSTFSIPGSNDDLADTGVDDVCDHISGTFPAHQLTGQWVDTELLQADLPSNIVDNNLRCFGDW